MPQQAAGALFRFVRDDAFALDAQYEVLLLAVAEHQPIEVVAPDVRFRVGPRPDDLDGRMPFGDLALERRLEDGILGGRLAVVGNTETCAWCGGDDDDDVDAMIVLIVLFGVRIQR